MVVANMNNLTRQHEEIIELVGKLETFDTPGKLTADAFAVSMLLAQLSGKISVHLASEDKFLYPQLKAGGNLKTLQVIEEFTAEMTNLAQAFNEFKSKYLASSRIAADTDSFLKEARKITSAIRIRIDRENQNLYPLINSF
jgi:hemerythrin-like domain-containing protein